MGFREYTIEWKKDGTTLPWLNDKVVDNYADLAKCLARCVQLLVNVYFC